MARKVFYTFRYADDSHRVQQVKNMGAVEGQPLLSTNGWEDVKAGGDAAIQKWIDDNMKGKSCDVVLIGSATAGRKWVNYEVKKAWNDGRGLVGIHIHHLKNLSGQQSDKGRNPFDDFSVGSNSVRLSEVVKAYDPPYTTSTNAYSYIKDHIADWVEEAITIRNEYS
ncbi:TIR domain-containing protein [Williamsia muralis]|uniref:TIR domain-containing protein n=1 Tax=Williamsia marianensis TaxID=85044 RepID=A0ABU4F0P5_WILMA|nr:TIR domain-containing protein [Williamsia muralis]MDV7137072.1 TIR domain-containing protein [Williamsia muralis]